MGGSHQRHRHRGKAMQSCEHRLEWPCYQPSTQMQITISCLSSHDRGLDQTESPEGRSNHHQFQLPCLWECFSTWEANRQVTLCFVDGAQVLWELVNTHQPMGLEIRLIRVLTMSVRTCLWILVPKSTIKDGL